VGVTRGSFGRRSAAFGIDQAILLLPYLIPIAIAESLFPTGHNSAKGGIEFAGWTLIDVPYFGFMSATGATVGMRLLRLRIAPVDGRPHLSVGWGIVRAAVMAAGVVVVVGLLWMLWDRDRRTWHDQASRSIVVHEDPTTAPG
jgi:uncharacterized RDD family membrane protein YckC